MLKYRNTILLTLFSAGTMRAYFVPSSFNDAATLAIVGLTFAYLEYKNQDKKVATLEQQFETQQKQISELQDKISSIKVIQQAKPGSLTFRQ